MPITVSQVRDPKVTLPLASPLQSETWLTIEWDVTESTVQEQICAIDLDHQTGHSFTHWVGSSVRVHTFKLPAGTIFNPDHLRCRVEINAASTMESGATKITFPSIVSLEREAITAIYSEHSQELRRMRTFFESFLVLVTGGFAILVNQVHSIVRSRFVVNLMGLGLVALSLIIIWLVWRVAKRYDLTERWLKNMEIGLGLRSGSVPIPLMPESVDKAWRHYMWALALMLYTFVLGVCSWIILANKDVGATPPATPSSLRYVHKVRLWPTGEQ